MSENRICTFEQLSAFVRSSVSEKRYLHSIGVAQSAQMLLEYYGCRNYEKTWKGFCAPAFCGIIHDLAREKTEKGRAGRVPQGTYEQQRPFLRDS